MKMPEGAYIASVLAIAFTITFMLRAVPFAILKPLRASVFVRRLAIWMPVGILGILAVSTFIQSAGEDGRHLGQALAATAVTAGVHLGFGRRTLLSVGAGTLTYVALLSLT